MVKPSLENSTVVSARLPNALVKSLDESLAAVGASRQLALELAVSLVACMPHAVLAQALALHARGATGHVTQQMSRALCDSIGGLREAAIASVNPAPAAVAAPAPARPVVRPAAPASDLQGLSEVERAAAEKIKDPTQRAEYVAWVRKPGKRK